MNRKALYTRRTHDSSIGAKSVSTGKLTAGETAQNNFSSELC